MAQPAYDYDDADFDPAAPLEEAEHGKVIYLRRKQQETVAVMPASLAHEALDALEDAQDLAAIKAAREEGGEPIPWEQVKAELDQLEAEGR